MSKYEVIVSVEGDDGSMATAGWSIPNEATADAIRSVIAAVLGPVHRSALASGSLMAAIGPVIARSLVAIESATDV